VNYMNLTKKLEKTLQKLPNVDRIETLSIRTSPVHTSIFITWKSGDEDIGDEPVTAVGFNRETGK